MTSLREPVEPLVIFPGNWGRFISVKLNTRDLPGTLQFLEDAWYDINPDFAFSYFFVDDSFAQLYEADQRLGRFFGLFALLAVLIACLGLFGLASYTTEKRTKEIGIRKVLGASVPGLFKLLSKEFAGLVLLANLIAWPVAYMVMNQWLQGFAYRIDMAFAPFLLAGILGLGITLLTVSYQSIKAAIADPAVSLRNDG